MAERGGVANLSTTAMKKGGAEGEILLLLRPPSLPPSLPRGQREQNELSFEFRALVLCRPPLFHTLSTRTVLCQDAHVLPLPV